MTAVAAVLAAAAAALVVRPVPRLRGRDPRLDLRSSWRLLPWAAPGLLFVLHGHALAAALIVASAACGFGWLAARGRARKVADETRVRVIEACEAMASELRSGRPPVVAVERGAELWPGMASVVAASRLDADVPDAFRRAARQPGAGVLEEAAAAWYVCQSVGAGLADAMERVVENARGQLATHRLVASELASALATAKMVAILPVVLLVLSDGSGSDPWRFLLQTGPGLAALAAGLALVLAGLWWIDRIVMLVQAGEL